MSEANKDEGLKCLRIAQEARAAGNIERARRFAEKALALNPTSEVEVFLRTVQSSTSTSAAGSGPSEPSVRQRATASARTNGAAPSKDQGTTAQREMVSRIRAAKGDYYKVLGLEKGADDDEVKKAYRKLALKLHPDKCRAPGAEEAFKEVSKAFSCLTDPQKRAYYDRTGHEDHHAAAAARSNGRGPMGRPMSGEIDPEELFNMMFGGGFGRGPMHFGGMRAGGRAGPRPQQQAQQQHGVAGNAALQALYAAWASSTLYHKLTMLMVLLQFLPLFMGLFSWLWWGVLFGLPVWVVAREIDAFDRRPLYQSIRASPAARDAVRAALPYARWYLSITEPAAEGVRRALEMLSAWARSVAAV